jgi:hypothetical protein
MQPLLFGDPDHGDVVLVDKLASARAVRRGDLVVLRKAEDASRQLVKRVAALGDDPAACCIDLREGDIWLGPDRQTLHRVQKDPIAARDLRVTWIEWPLRSEETLEHFVRVPSGATRPLEIALPLLADDVPALLAELSPAARAQRPPRAENKLFPAGFLGTVRALDGSYLDTRSRRGREGGSIAIDDLGLDLDLSIAAAASDLLCCLELRPDVYVFRWHLAAGEVELWRNGERQAAAPAPAKAGRCRLEYGALDGRFFFAVDGVVRACIERLPEWTPQDPGPTSRPGPKNLLYVGCFGRGGADTGAGVERLCVFRDLYWARERTVGLPADAAPSWPWLVPPGQVFLLGDNSFDSMDSRTHGPYELASYLGRPLAVIGPWPHARWLVR